MSEPPAPPRADRTNVAALIPAYLEERHLEEVVRRVARQLDFVLVVDDGSTDGTTEAARRGGAEILRHSVNAGKGAAIKTGLRHLAARPGLAGAILLDGDGQHLPEEISRFLDEANRGRAALLLGNRMSDAREMPLVRTLTNRFMSWQISRLCGQPLPDTQCGFRFLRPALFPLLAGLAAEKYEYETEMLVAAARRGHRIASVPVSTIYGEEKSKIRPLKDTVRFFRLLRRLRREKKTDEG